MAFLSGALSLGSRSTPASRTARRQLLAHRARADRVRFGVLVEPGMPGFVQERELTVHQIGDPNLDASCRQPPQRTVARPEGRPGRVGWSKAGTEGCP